MDDGGKTGLGLCIAHNNKILFQSINQYHQTRIMESDRFGKILFIDNIPVSSEADCDNYDEMMVHVPMMVM